VSNQDGSTILTEISAKQWNFITQDNLSAREAVAFLLNGMQLRTFRDILRQVCGTDDIEKQLVQGLSQQTASSYMSTRRKVRNWMSGKNMPTEREDVFQICFALKLGLDQSGRLLNLLTDQGIHYRNAKEMIYAYCLKNELGYGYAQQLVDQYFGSKNHKNTHREPVTRVIEQGFAPIREKEDLFTFMMQNQSVMGSTHNTAYAYFCKMLALLTCEEMEGESQYSMEYVANTYLRLNVPQEKKTGRYTDTQKMVKKYWPGARSIKAMKSRSEDVTRKTLLLMYLVTGGVWESEYDELDESYIQPKEFLETHCRRMNRMLMECGMRRIDPRNVFDYLVLYCLRPEDEMFMSDRMAQLAAELFREP